MSPKLKLIIVTLMVSILSLNFVNAADINAGAKVIKEAGKKIPFIKRTKDNALELAKKRADAYLKAMSVKKYDIAPLLYDRIIDALSKPRSFLAKLEVLAPINKPGFEIGIIARFYDGILSDGQIRTLMSRILSDSKDDFDRETDHLQSYITVGMKKLGQSFANARQDGLLHGVATGAEDIIAAIIKITIGDVGNHTKAEFAKLQEIVVEAATKELSISPEKILNTRLFKDKILPPTALQIKYVRSIDVSTLKSSESVLQWWKQGLGKYPSDLDYRFMLVKLKKAMDPIIEEYGYGADFITRVFEASRSNKKFAEVVEDLLNIEDIVD